SPSRARTSASTACSRATAPSCSTAAWPPSCSRCSPRTAPGGASRGEPGRCSRGRSRRSEEHTSELQSRFDLVCRLVLEKKKTEVAIAKGRHVMKAIRLVNDVPNDFTVLLIADRLELPPAKCGEDDTVTDIVTLAGARRC